MPFPSTLTLVTVAIQADLPPSGGATGYLDFTAPYPLLGPTDGSIIPPHTRRATLAANGSATIQLPATNDPQWSPTGWAYTVDGRINGETISGTLQLDYQTTSVQLADLLQVDGTTVAGTSYLLTAQRSVANGVAGLDADGDVINAAGDKVGEAAGGGIPETIIDAKGDLIAGTAANTAARLPAGTDGQYLKAASGETTGLQWDTLTSADITDSTSVGRAVLTAANAAAGRTAIGAEATGVAAALVDDLSGVTDATTARTNLGLGGAAVLNVGTTAGTVAAGDAPASAIATHVGLPDPHTQYALEANLGNAAGLNVGTSAGTVAAGNDSRITGALQTTGGTISGDLTVQETLSVSPGALLELGADVNLYRSAANTMATDDALSVGGNLSTFGNLAVDPGGSPTFGGGTGVVFLADGTAPASNPSGGGLLYYESGNPMWRNPAGDVVDLSDTGGGGGGSIAIAHGYIKTGDVTPQTTGSWAAMTSGPTFSIAAVVGDEVTVDWTALIDPVSNMFLDLCVLVSGAPVRYAATGTSSAGVEGDPGLYPDVPAFFPTRGLGMTVTCESGDLSGGNITFGFAVINPNGGGKLYASTNYPLRYRILNCGS